MAYYAYQVRKPHTTMRTAACIYSESEGDIAQLSKKNENAQAK